MPSRAPFWRGLLYVLAVALPCLSLVALAARGLSQEKELIQARRLDQQTRTAQLVGSQIAARLDATAERVLDSRGDPAGSPVPGLLAVGEVRGGRLLLAWDLDAEARAAEFSAIPSNLVRALREAERRELVARDPRAASARYRELLARVPDPAVRASIRLRLARALHDAGDFRASERESRILLASGFDLTDAAGVPVALYGAARLAPLAGWRDSILMRLAELRGTWDRVAPAGLYLASEMVDSIAATGPLPASATSRLRADFTARLERVRLLSQLQAGFQLPPPPRGAEPPVGGIWLGSGPDAVVVGPILIGSDSVMSSFPVVVLEVDSLVADLVAPILSENPGAGGVVALATDPDALGLGPRLHGLGVTVFTTSGGPQGGMRLFYVAGLALVLLVMVGGTALLWRDVRREVMMADLRSRFVAAVSHELKTPLTSIRLFAETLKRGTVTDERERQEYLDTIVAEGERLSRLIRNVLDYGQIERSEKRYLRRPESLQDIVHDTVRSVDHPLRTQGYRLAVTMEDDLPDALVDRDAIEQAILNLLSNAMKYSGGTRDLELRLRREGATALIEVVDHGIGIPPEEQEHIFEQFHRGRLASEAGIPGSGLGLTLVRHIAAAHGGAVTVRSAPNAGSTFTLRLPLAPVP